MHTSDVLIEEHRLITALIDALSACTAPGRQLDVALVERLVDALANCLGQLHIVKEERAFFPLLQARGLPKDHAVVAALLDQHESGRAYLRRMRGACTWVRAEREDAVAELQTMVAEFRGLIHEHVRIEDEYFYQMAQRQLLPEDIEPLERAFAAIDESVGGPTIRAFAREVLESAGLAAPGA